MLSVCIQSQKALVYSYEVQHTKNNICYNNALQYDIIRQ